MPRATRKGNARVTRGWKGDSPERATDPGLRSRGCDWAFSDVALRDALETINRGDALYGSARPQRFKVVEDPETEKETDDR